MTDGPARRIGDVDQAQSALALVVSGFLGSGKTTLVQNLLRRRRSTKGFASP